MTVFLKNSLMDESFSESCQTNSLFVRIRLQEGSKKSLSISVAGIFPPFFKKKGRPLETDEMKYMDSIYTDHPHRRICCPTRQSYLATAYCQTMN